jgi:release factor glutamine methyltransferase
MNATTTAQPRPQDAPTAGDAKRWTVLELLRWTQEFFAARGIDTARLDAEVLLAHALGIERLRLYLEFEKPVTADERATFRELVRRRAEQRVPVAYLTGQREFWSLKLSVTPDVLVPRPDTETLVEAVLARWPGATASVLEIGTGSGAIALALATEKPEASFVATDVSAAALAVAARNAAALGLEGRVRFAEGDLFAAVPEGRFDAIVSNPPYVARSAAPGLAPELGHEPEGALFAEDDGLALLRGIVLAAPARLAPGGLIGLELDPAQAETVAAWLEAAGFGEVTSHRDLGGRVRVLTATRDRTEV